MSDMANIDMGLQQAPDSAKALTEWQTDFERREKLHQKLPERLADFAYWLGVYNRRVAKYGANDHHAIEILKMVEKAKWNCVAAGADPANLFVHFSDAARVLEDEGECDDYLAYQGGYPA